MFIRLWGFAEAVVAAGSCDRCLLWRLLPNHSFASRPSPGSRATPPRSGGWVLRLHFFLSSSSHDDWFQQSTIQNQLCDHLALRGRYKAFLHKRPSIRGCHFTACQQAVEPSALNAPSGAPESIHSQATSLLGEPPQFLRYEKLRGNGMV